MLAYEQATLEEEGRVSAGGRVSKQALWRLEERGTSHLAGVYEHAGHVNRCEHAGARDV